MAKRRRSTGKMRFLRLEYYCGKIERVRYTKSSYWAAAGNKAIKTYGMA